MSVFFPPFLLFRHARNVPLSPFPATFLRNTTAGTGVRASICGNIRGAMFFHVGFLCETLLGQTDILLVRKTLCDGILCSDRPVLRGKTVLALTKRCSIKGERAVPGPLFPLKLLTILVEERSRGVHQRVCTVGVHQGAVLGRLCRETVRHAR